MDCRSDHSCGVSHVKDHAFIVTKPLQLMVALSIMHQLEISERSQVIVVDAFAGARGVAERLAFLPEPFSGISVEFVDSVRTAYHLVRQNRFSVIFIDADVGVRKCIDLLRSRLSNFELDIRVYEEGLGTYRKDLYRGIKRSLLDFLGVGTRFGGFRLTSKLYLYAPDDYRESFPTSKVSLELIVKPLSAFIIDNFTLLSRLFDYKPPAFTKSHRCNLYLSNWAIDDLFISRFLALLGDSYIKPHPHITDFKNNNPHSLVVDPAIPAEIAILGLLELYESVDVYHHGSSVARYIANDSLNYITIE